MHTFNVVILMLCRMAGSYNCNLIAEGKGHGTPRERSSRASDETPARWLGWSRAEIERGPVGRAQELGRGSSWLSPIRLRQSAAGRKEVADGRDFRSFVAPHAQQVGFIAGNQEVGRADRRHRQQIIVIGIGAGGHGG